MKTLKFAFEIYWPLRAYSPNIYTVPRIVGIRSGEVNPVVPDTKAAAKVKTTGQVDCISVSVG